MITFGYKNRFSGFTRAIIALALGTTMLFVRDSMALIVYIVAAFVLASGIVSLIIGLKKEPADQRSLVIINSAFNIVIAILMFVFAHPLGNIVGVLLGVVLLLFGGLQLIVMISANRVAGVGKVSFIMPAIVIACGALLMSAPWIFSNLVGIIAGSSLIVYGVSELISSWKMQQTMKDAGTYQSASQKTAPTASEKLAEAFKDVEYEKVDEQ